MLREFGRLVGVICSIVSLYAVFETAFLAPAADIEQRILDTLAMLGLAAAVSLLGGVAFYPSLKVIDSQPRLLFTTLPVKLLGWGMLFMTLLFALATYLEANHFLNRNVLF